MGNPCKVIITRGANKGKVCGQVNPKCKHVSEPLVCIVCHNVFDRTTSYYRHINLHHNGKAKLGSSKSQDPEDQEERKIKVAVNVKNQPASLTHVYNRLIELEEQNIALREEVAELKLKPTTTNYIAILGNDFYTELSNKIGRENAMKFIAESGIKHPLSVFKKIYLDDRKPDDYPIACRDRCHFRYLDSQKNMVDDRDGKNIGNVVSKGLSEAVENAVHDFAGRPENEGYSYTVQQIKNSLSQLDQHSVIKELAYITNNPNHPFFRD